MKTFVRDGMAINQRIPVPDDSIGGVFANMADDQGRPLHEPAAGGFFAQALLNMPLGNGQMAQTQFEFQIPGATVHEAFANFAAALEENKKKAEASLRQQVVQQQILSASGAPMPPRPRSY